MASQNYDQWLQAKQGGYTSPYLPSGSRSSKKRVTQFNKTAMSPGIKNATSKLPSLGAMSPVKGTPNKRDSNTSLNKWQKWRSNMKVPQTAHKPPL